MTMASGQRAVGEGSGGLRPTTHVAGGGGSARGEYFRCKTCSKTFTSFQALGGHRTGHTRMAARQRQEHGAAGAAVVGATNNQRRWFPPPVAPVRRVRGRVPHGAGARQAHAAAQRRGGSGDAAGGSCGCERRRRVQRGAAGDDRRTARRRSRRPVKVIRRLSVRNRSPVCLICSCRVVFSVW